MNQGHAVSKSGIEPGHILISKGYLRNQQDYLFSPGQHSVHQFHIYLCLSAACHSLDKTGSWILSGPLFQNLLHSPALVLVQADFTGFRQYFRKRRPKEAFPFQRHKTFLFKSLYHGRGNLQFLQSPAVFQTSLLHKSFQKPGLGFIMFFLVPGQKLLTLLFPCLQTEQPLLLGR